MSLAVDWSEMNPDLLDLIIKRLDLVAFIRAGAVCRSWRSAVDASTYISPPNSHTPWLIFSSPNQPEHLYVNNPADPKSLYKFNLPNIKHHFVIGSSHGFIISVDEIGQIHATNPVTGSHKRLPDIASLLCCEGVVRDPATNRISSYLIRDRYVWTDHPDHHHLQFVRKCFYNKVAMFSTSSAGLISVIIHNFFGELAFACEADESWTSIESPIIHFQDVLFYKGLLYAVNGEGCLVAFDILNFSASSTPVIYVEGWTERFGSCYTKRYLVQSPCASDLFLIAMFSEFPLPTTGFEVYKLNQDIYQWSKVSSFGTDHVVVFLDFEQSVMVLAKDIPSIALNKGDYICFVDYSRSSLNTEQMVADMCIFCMEDNEIARMNISDHDLQQFCFTLPFWFTPVNK